HTTPSTPPISLSIKPPLHHPVLHSFPTRRSSDLCCLHIDASPPEVLLMKKLVLLFAIALVSITSHAQELQRWQQQVRNVTIIRRSEEHTFELQSPYDLVCRLLLEKKKKIKLTR